MDDNRTLNEEIEESLRICEELLSQNPDFIPEKPQFLEELDQPEKEEPEPEANPEPVSEPVRRIVPEKPKLVDDLKESEKVEPEKKQEPVSEPEQYETVQPLWRGEEFQKQPAAQDVEEKPETKEHGIRRTIICILVCVVIAVTAAILISSFVANHTTVEGRSMEPELASGDQLVVEKISYLTGKPQRYDVIVFNFNETIKYIKRVIGLPGETVRIDEEGKIYINDCAVFDEYGSGVIEDAGIAKNNVKLGEDEYFVLGDNRNASKDSRSSEVGMVKGDQIIGKAWLRVLPWETFGMIE